MCFSLPRLFQSVFSLLFFYAIYLLKTLGHPSSRGPPGVLPRSLLSMAALAPPPPNTCCQ